MTTEIWLPIIDEASCIGCGDCIMVCPTDSLIMVDNIAVIGDAQACNYCGECEAVCPAEAIALPYEIVLESDLNP